jgi:hypothetical protein
MIFRFGRISLSLLSATVLLLLSVAAFCADPTVTRITFAADQAGQFPAAWVAREGKAKEIYAVGSEGGKRFLHADAKASAVQIGYENKWPLKEYPVMRWQWRAVMFPANSDERKKEGGDSAAGIYVVFGRWPFIKSLKYVWSDTLPVGASFNSPFSGSTRIIVVRSGRSAAGTWVTESRNVLADYNQFFGNGQQNPVADGIALMTDSDNTESRAIADYGDIELLPPEKNRPSGP